jgi:Omp85 superfamily domain/WD40-like Beta Propeller Repeat
MRNAVRIVLSAFLLTLLASTAGAQQYFGRNKVQWENFDFKVLQTEHFDIYYYDQEEDVVRDVGRQAERWYARLSRVFNHSFKRKPIVLYANAADFHQTTTTGGFIGEGTGGFTDAFMNRVVLPLTGDRAEDDHVLGHEMVHVFQYDLAATAVQNRRRFALEALPLWIVEGMAEYLSKGRVDPLTAMWIRDATDHDRLPTIGQLTRDPRYFPYRYGQAIMAYIGARFGDEAVVRYFAASGSVGVEEGVERALGINAKQLFNDWKAASTELYAPVFEARPDSLAKPLIGRKPVRGEKRTRRSGGTELNIGPALSPDGKLLAFISARDLFSIDLFLADAHTGQIIRKLVSEDRDAHFESLRFLESAGSWSPDGRRLAFVTFAKGDNFLSIVDVESRATEHIKVPGVEAIMNVAWSPDGSTIAIAGQKTGASDLFLYNLSTKQVRQLTADTYSDLHPTWSPDGRMLAFISDRGPGTNLEQLKFARLGINTIDIGTGQIRQIPVFANAKHINPQFSADGRSIYFIANPEGVADIYRYDLGDNKTSRVTHVRTGVAGITELAPALSVARTGDIAFSLYEDDNYNLYTIPSNSQGAVTLTEMPTGIPRPALLPPLRGTGSEITAYLSRPEEGLPPANADFNERGYNADLRLAYLGPPTLGVGVGQYGFGAGGSVSAWFSDILGQHNVGFTFQGGGSSSTGGVGLQDQLGGELFYLNQKHRFNWGAGVLRIPYIASSPVTVRPGPNPQTTIYEQSLLVQTVTDVSALAQYPFSTTRRIESAAGVQQFGFKLLTDLFLVDQNGSIIDRETFTQENETINLAKASTAFVGDSSTYGFISPIRGTRYRYEIEALQGDINFQTGLADWRRYFFFRPLTLAVRGLYYGRYGEGAEDTRLSTLYVGSGSIGRGYDPYTINPIECVSTPGDDCPVLNRLIGTSIAAAGLELRAPLFGTREFGLINAPFLPTEIFAFGDMGAAWSDDDEITWKYATNTTERVPVFSVGIGLRVLLSYIPIEVFAAKPFQRPDESIVYGFNITPGW